MPITFPSNPSDQDEYTFNGRTYTYNASRGVWLGSRGGSVSAGGGGGAALTVSDTAPTSANEGDLWFHSTLLETYVYYNSQWVLSNPSGGSSGGSGGGTTTYATAAELPQTATNGDLALVEETDKLYIWNDTAWYNIALINTAPTITQGGAGSYELAIDGTPTVITLTATDPESVPVTWSYAVTGGSLTNGGGTTATVTQADNVFTITPTTTEAYAGEFTLTFSVTDGANIVNDVNSFSLVFVTIIDDSARTTLLLKTDATSSDNQIDASSNSHAITETGNITSTALTPYHPKGYSTYFDGSGDYIRYTDASLAEGTDDFTIEFWVKTNGTGVQNETVLGHDATPGYQISFSSGGLTFMKDVSNRLLNTGSLNDQQWYHVVYQRSSGTLQGFLDGTSLGTTTLNDNFTNTTIDIGVNRGGTDYFSGSLRDVRIIKGTALYSSSGFDVPTEALTAVSGTGYSTTLLTCHAPYITDGGANSLSATINGNTTTAQFSPYDHDPYSKLDFGGSVYFDGSGDYMSIPANDAFSFGAGDFTVEAWVYVDIAGIITSNIPIIGWDTGSYKIIRLNSSGINVESNSPSNQSFTVAFPEQPVTNVWNHIALVRSGNSFTAYLNGRGGTPWTFSGNVGNGTDQLNIGYKSDPAYYKGWMADLRIVKGTAVYTSDFTPPTEPLTAISGTSLLTCTNKNSIYDAAIGNTFEIGGNTTSSTTQTKYAGSSIYFDGSGDYIAKSSSSLFSMGSGDYTVELWAYFNSLPTAGNGWHMIFAARDGSDNGVAFYVDGPTPHVELYTNTLIASGATTLSTGQWYHLAYVRTNGTGKVFINGTEELSYSYTTSVGDATLYIAGFTSQFANMYIEDFRITKGLARYTANFTPPTGSLEG